MAAPKLNVKHVAPYPIPVRITKAEGQPPLLGVIVKMTEIGFLMKVDGAQAYKVGDTCHFSFDLPATHTAMDVDGKIIKTYDGFELVNHQKVKIRTIEVHFKALSDNQRNNIDNYLVQSGQKKR
jgi:hypothetical protein